ncbi:MAG: FMN-binding protein [Actinomycetota bacterium]|nr:FMN-binding protein [Actinomycetota bacterium]
MKRSFYVITGTGVGLIGVLSFQSSPAKVTLGSSLPTSGSTATTVPSSPTTSTASSSATTAAPTTTAAKAASSQAPAATAAPAPTSAPSPTSAPATTAAPTTTASPTTTAAAGPASATGPTVNYYFGTLAVTATATGHKITNVTVSSLSDGGNSRSASIDQYAIPILEQEAMQAQSANIQNVSGASYTTAGFAQSLQGALAKLGI